MKSIKQKTIAFVLLLVVMASLLSVGIVLFRSNQGMNTVVDEQFSERLKGAERMLKLYLYEQFGELSLSDNAELVGATGEGVSGKFEYIDEFSEALGVEATIFKRESSDFVRVLTSILDDKGARVVGTVLDPSSEAYSEVNAGREYIGNAHILGTAYVTIYTPLFSGNDVVGVYFVGIPNETVTETISNGFRTIIQSLLVGMIVILAISAFASYFLGTYISKPIVAITTVMSNLSKLDFQFDSKDPVVKFSARKDEIGSMIRSVKEMRDHVASFIVKASSSTEQLAATAEEMTATANQSSTAAEEVAQTIADIARGATDQAERQRVVPIGLWLLEK